MARAFHLRVVRAVRPDFAARRAFYAGDLARRALDASRATSRLVLEGERGDFGAVLTFFASAADADAADGRLAPLRAELDRATATFGEFQRLLDVRGGVLGSIRVDAAREGLPALLAFGRADPPAAVPGQQSVFLARLRASEGTEALVHVASAPPRDAWPAAAFVGRGVVVHVDHGDAMP